MEKLREQYEKEVVPALMKKFQYKSIMQVPKLDKVVINIGLGDTKENPKSLENAMNDLMQITGQVCQIVAQASTISQKVLYYPIPIVPGVAYGRMINSHHNNDSRPIS